MDPVRRRLLKRLAQGAALASTAPSLGKLLAANESGSTAARRIRGGKVHEIAQMLLRTPREKVFAATVEHIAAGANHREVLGATLLAGVQDVRPWPPGTKFHVVLMVPSALDLAEASPARDLWLPVFFNIHTLKNSQQRDVEVEGDWQLPPAPKPLGDDPERVRKVLVESMEAWDLKTADRAMTAAARLFELDELFELLWPIGARDFQNIGHQMIHTSQLYRALAMLDGHHREPALRSLMYGVLGGKAGPTTADFERNRARVGELPAKWRNGKRDNAAALDLFRGLRGASATAASDTVVELLRHGVSPDSIWDGMRVFASEVLFRIRDSKLRNAQLLSVHALTIVNAFRFAYERTRSDTTRRLLLLQAASFMPLSRELLKEAKKLSMKGPGFDALEAPADPVSAKQAADEADRDAVKSGSMVLRVARDRAEAERYIDVCRAMVVRKAPEHHHHKYSAAAFEEFRKTDPGLAPYVLATCLSYLPTPAAEESDVTKQARAALRHIGS